ncbi:hypothetical protein KIN20_027008 [Parelaphostrongylus tenuis]|uniref:Uncharacterized protein n=1 Tax=Parelaphostrongylus tenuis TaxID=148309 RepID=A0AAD5WDP1_PARTN|nr:hypothetical protein KIN20_027008 [Parelaphostrongylus tenuis]
MLQRRSVVAKMKELEALGLLQIGFEDQFRSDRPLKLDDRDLQAALDAGPPPSSRELVAKLSVNKDDLELSPIT